ncbi:MAG: hypothetical protein EOP06_26395, partial [Proteobacteria bacterium]
MSTYVKFDLTTETGVPGLVSQTTTLRTGAGAVMDGDVLYLNSSFYTSSSAFLNRIYRINTVTNTVEFYAGSGTSVGLAQATDPSQLAIFSSAALAFDPRTKDLYLVNWCTNGTGSTGSDPIIIQKISQNSSTRAAQAVSLVAGKCAGNSTPVDGALATATSIQNHNFRHFFGSLIFSPANNALYFAPYGSRLLKIINGKVFFSDYPGTNFGAGALVSEQNKIFWSVHRSGAAVASFVPNSNDDFDEAVTLEIGDEPSCISLTCREDGQPLASSAVAAATIFSMQGKVGIADGSTSSVRLRVVDDSTSPSTLQTIAGTDRFWGHQKDRRLARFSNLSSLVFK